MQDRRRMEMTPITDSKPQRYINTHSVCQLCRRYVKKALMSTTDLFRCDACQSVVDERVAGHIIRVEGDLQGRTDFDLPTTLKFKNNELRLQ